MVHFGTGRTREEVEDAFEVVRVAGRLRQDGRQELVRLHELWFPGDVLERL